MKNNDLLLHSILITIVIVSSTFSLAFGYSDNVESLIKKGRDAIYGQNFTGAIFYFDQILKIEPNNTAGLINKGVALGNLQNFTGAISYFDEALKINPNNTDALNNKGAALIKEGKFNEANSTFDKVLKIEPKNLVALSNKKVISHRFSSAFTKPYDTSRYTLFTQVEIRDKDNQLVSYLEPQIIQIPDPNRFDLLLDTWSVGKFNQSGVTTIVEKSIIKKDGKDFEKIRFIKSATYDSDNMMVSRTGYAENGIWIIFGYHDGYQLERGDKETLTFTIIRPVG